MSKVDNIANINSNNVQKKAQDEFPVKQKKGGTVAKGPANASSRTSPAFRGAKFDKYGYCLKHTSMQLAKPMKDENGRVVFKELRQSCPSCQSEKHKAKRVTSLGGGKENAGRRTHGMPASSTGSRSRSKSRGPGENASSRGRARSKARDAKPRREYDTPFDSKGRCHYHVNVQLASKKMSGGWKVLQAACPKCMECNLERAGRSGGSDDRSVRSGSSRKSHRSGTNDGGDADDAHGQYDKNGCCVLHPHIQVAKKKLLGGGFKVVRECPQCGGGDVGADDYSVKSGKSAKSARSATSRKSGRSVKSGARGKPGAATGSGRYGSLPFDNHGYCCRHPNVQLAKKKALGGFKILHHVCPECQLDDGGGRAPSRRRSRGTGRFFGDTGSEVSSKSGASAKKKRIRVRNLRTEDEEGKPGQYTGYVNEGHQPHGDGVMKYADGSRYDGVWSEGSKVHGKATKRKGQ